jgi:hypothetical protein
MAKTALGKSSFERRSGQLVGVDLFVDCAGPGKRCLLVHLLEDLDDPEDEAEADGDEPA